MPATERFRVLLLIPHLGGGGAERVTELLARGLSKDKYEVHLGVVTQREAGRDLAACGVRVHALGARRVRSGALHLLRLVRRVRPDVILSGMAHLNFLVLLLRPLFFRKTRVLVRQNSTASAALEFGGLPAYTRILYQLLYRRADRVICQTGAMAADLAAHFGVPEMRLTVLPNPVDFEDLRRRAYGIAARRDAVTQDSCGHHLLAVGRLSREKGFDLLLEAFARIRAAFPNAYLTIAGAGPQEEALQAQCRDLGLEQALRFPGYTSDLPACFASASVFVLPSRYEGLPNALLEAGGCGLPIVAFLCSQGVTDLLRGQRGVWLAREISADALAEALNAALSALEPGERFQHAFVEPFERTRAIAAYEAMLDSVLREVQR
jgi:glycosyltransferase involved in cell wall biosynthesis